MNREGQRAITRGNKEIRISLALQEVALNDLLDATAKVGAEFAVDKYRQSSRFEEDAMAYCEGEGWVEHDGEDR